MCLNDWLARRRLYTPHRVGVVDDATGRRYRYVELDQRAGRVAQHLRQALSVKHGDRVACLSANRLEYLDLYFACGKIGAVLVPLNVRLAATSLFELLQDCQPGVLVYDADFAVVAETAKREELVSQIFPIDSADQDSLAGVSADDSLPPGELDVHQADESDTAMILYTSGTTGRAKGAMISYRQIHWNALSTILGLQLSQDDTAFLNMPLYHTGGWHVLFTPLVLVGGRLILQQRFDAQRCNALLGPEGITILFGVPTTLQMMCDTPNFASADFSTVRFAIFGGERCPLPVIEAYESRGVAMRQGYGLTEAGPNCFSLPADDSVRKQGSIGIPNFFVRARLQRDAGEEAATGEVGELLMSGPHLFAGYWNNPAATNDALRDGWLATGDLMTRDEDGYYFVVGRKKDMFISGGENVYPAQVERVLQGHDAVALAAVIGVPHPKWGETGWAFVQLAGEATADEEELIARCKQQLAAFQCPTKILFLDNLPMGDSGKIDKRKLAAMAAELAEQ